MSINTSEGIQSFPHESGSTVSEIVESFVESTAKLAESLDAPEERVSDFKESGEELGQLVEGIAQEAAQARESAHANEAELKETRTDSAKERAEIKQRVTTLEESEEEPDSGGTNPTPDGEETTLHKPETPLEEVVQLPEHLAEENLSANQQRARFVAKDIHEYSRSVPAGRVIKSSELRRVLTASEEGRVHTETVSRVISFLDDLGQESVQLRETQAGERVVVFTEEIVKRIVAFHNSNHTVVSGGEVSG